MQNQIYIFIAFILNGILIGISFDIFRVLRKTFKTPDWITYIQDVLFGLLSGAVVLFSTIKFNNGELRTYIFLGIIFGISIYLLVFSSIFIKTMVFLIKILKNLIQYLIIIPLKKIYKIIKKIFFKPIIFVCVNFKKQIKRTCLFKIKKQKNKVNFFKEKLLFLKSTKKYKK